MKQEIIERLIRYLKIDTQSDPESKTTPSTMKQFDLANLLVDELKSMGLTQVELDDKCYIYATLESNIPENHPAYGKVPNIGFIAHLDTSPDTTGANVNPQIIENYQGGDIVLPNDNSVVIKVSENKSLEKCIGHTIITTDGTTLLGSDDKSGITAIMTAIKFLIDQPEILHGNIKIGFTPDEEIGKGANYFDIKKFDCEYAYTIDGEMPGEINKETFSANSCIIRAYGRDIHPGYAKDIMINSIRAIADIVALMPKDMAPETTEGYQPYIHPHKLTSTVAKSELHILFRDFKTSGLDEQKKIMEDIIEKVKPNHPNTKFELEIIEYYRNMLDDLEKNPKGLDYLWEACERIGVKPFWSPIRGGTDGSRLTAMGLPTPNIFTGGQNFHSKTEWVSIDYLQKSVEVIVELAKVWLEKSINN